MCNRLMNRRVNLAMKERNREKKKKLIRNYYITPCYSVDKVAAIFKIVYALFGATFLPFNNNI